MNTFSPEGRRKTLKKKRSGDLKTERNAKQRFEDISKKSPSSNVCQFYRYIILGELVIPY